MLRAVVVAFFSKIAEMLGSSSGATDGAGHIGPDEVKLRQRARQNALQERIAKATRLREAETRAADRLLIRERYTPLDSSIAHGELDETLVKSDLAGFSSRAPKRQRVTMGSQETVVEEPFPGVFVFPLLSEALCERIWSETEHYLSQAACLDLPRPTRHDGCLDLSHVFPELLGHIAAAAMPAIHALLPEELHSATLRHAFRTYNYVGREEDFKRHVDKYDVTLNVCLRKTSDVKGSGIFFFSSQSSEAASHRHQHSVGLAVLHSSKEWHQTEALTAGERGSVIMWFACA